MSYTYSDTYLRLGSEVAIIVFIKASGDVRLMLATRDMLACQIALGEHPGEKLNMMDRRCNTSNQNIGVIDLILGEARCFKLSRVIDIEYLGEIHSKGEMEQRVQQFLNFKRQYEETAPKNVMDTFKPSEAYNNTKSAEEDDLSIAMGLIDDTNHEEKAAPNTDAEHAKRNTEVNIDDIDIDKLFRF